MRPFILITGASGMVGREIVRHLYCHSDATLILLLHRNSAPFREQWHRMAILSHPSRTHVLYGNVTAADLGLSADEQGLLMGSVTHIIHSAACTRFDLPLGDARAINVEGTRNVARFAGRCLQLQKLAHISTAYVSGRRSGRVRESDLIHDAGFVNTYEQSKYEAEGVLRFTESNLPSEVYRLSTVLGDSRTGNVYNMTATHHAIRIMYMGMAAVVPGTADYRVDLIPADYAASVVSRLVLAKGEASRTFHITASPEKSFTLPELIEATYSALASSDPEWARRRYPKPVLSTGEAFEMFVETAKAANNPLLLSVVRAIEHFARQLTYPKSFDRSNVKQILPRYDDELPDVREYFAKVVHRCVQTRWGKHAA